MRLVVAATLIAGGLLVTCMSLSHPARADPETCPPVCDQIPDTAWISREAIPLNSTYHWPSPAGVGRVDDRWCDAAVPVRRGVRDAGVPAGHPQRRGRQPRDGGQAAGPVAAAGRSRALAR